MESRSVVGPILCVALGGCSLSIGAVPNRPRGAVPRCDVNRNLVALDAITASAATIVGGAALIDGDTAKGTVVLAIGAAVGAAALRGLARTGDCRTQYASYTREFESTSRGGLVQAPEAPPIAWQPEAAPSADPAPPSNPPPPPAATQPQPVAPRVPEPEHRGEWGDFWTEGPR